LSIKLLEQMKAHSAVMPLCKIVEEYFCELKDKQDFDARLATIPWIDCLTVTAEALGKLADVDPKREEHKESVRQTLHRLLVHSLKNYEEKTAVAALNSLIAWGETDLLTPIASMLGNDTPSQIAALQAIETIAHRLNPEDRQTFVNIHFRNPSDDNNSVTLMYYRAALALNAADPTLVHVEPIERAIEEARQLYTYGGDLWNQFRIIECETVGKFSQLDIEKIRPYLKSSNTDVRDAAEAAHHARGIPFVKYQTLEWPLIWKTIAHAGADMYEKADAPSENSEGMEDVAVKVASLMQAENAVGFAPPAAWLWQHPSEKVAAILAGVVDKKLDELPKIESGEYLSSEYTWLLRALVKHAAFPPCIPVISRGLAHENHDVSGALLQDFDNMPIRFVPQLVKLAIEREGWQRYNIGKWLIQNKEIPDIAAALKTAGITSKKLKSWIS
ncbi:MAG TPA: hypothetical protein PKZ32_18100, partial [Candidatus Melainabacteria bacterium]|nr:hypothetical protein [Candidatus Melainabacteria bacterium]